MKTTLKIIGVGVFFYALTLYSNEKTREAIRVEKDSLWHYYNLSIDDIREIENNRNFEGKLNKVNKSNFKRKK
jgi:hypothetical protein